MNIFVEEHRDILQKLLENDVDFILVGGYAVIYYGYRRTTSDMDIWLAPDNANKVKFLKALLAAGFDKEDLLPVKNFDFERHVSFCIGEEPEKIDFLTYISGVSYAEAAATKILADVGGLNVPIVHINQLIISKLSTDRLKDKADVEELQKVLRDGSL